MRNLYVFARFALTLPLTLPATMVYVWAFALRFDRTADALWNFVGVLCEWAGAPNERTCPAQSGGEGGDRG